MIIWGASDICMISILTKGRDIPRDGCGGHPGAEQCFGDMSADKSMVSEFIEGVSADVQLAVNLQPGYRQGNL